MEREVCKHTLFLKDSADIPLILISLWITFIGRKYEALK